MKRIGIDVGSTTAKVVLIDAEGAIHYSRYERHNARIAETIGMILDEVAERYGEERVNVGITGSIGMGIASRAEIAFVQEVTAAARAVKSRVGCDIQSMIDIGGEDAKVVFFNKKGEPTDLRMNGNCAAGTGSFLDQMSVILGEPIGRLSDMALTTEVTHPIASRCGVFCKTDIQNLVAKNVSKAEVSASIFHAVAVQTVVTLAHGYDIEPPVLFCGGPLTFIPALQRAFKRYLKLEDSDVIVPQDGRFYPAIGAAMGAENGNEMTVGELKERIGQSFRVVAGVQDSLPAVFPDAESYELWRKRISRESITTREIDGGIQEVYLGIDSGSTTTKVVFTDVEGRILYHYYHPNKGDPIGTAAEGMRHFDEYCQQRGAKAIVRGSCSTGYGEDLLKAAFRLDHGIIETIAHYLAASRLDPEVSFILDIGGQDMKAIYVERGVINRIEINEACSSGCGSFIETFAASLGMSASEFAALACKSQHPCDLGTRCTVFMNSKVKQVLREGVGSEDIAAGLAYSVVRNCLYKVLKLKDTTTLGEHIVVQGGTMKNDAVVRALENMTGAQVSRSDHPELMGAYGCALYAIENRQKEER